MIDHAQDSDIVIETHGLGRDFNAIQAVATMDLSIHKGELFGLVGPDGAGKTTTLRLLAGLLSITRGSGTILNYDLARQAEPIKTHIGYMAQRFSLYDELTVLENLQFFGDLYDIPTSVLSSRLDRLLSFAGLGEFVNRRAEHLSGGMQKKLALACTLIHAPEILLLDEPTTGVDPISRREFWNILTDLHLDGTTILVSTPYMDEADRCSRVGLIYEGRLIVCDEPKVIRANIPGELVAIQTDSWQSAISLLEPLPGVLEVQTYGDSLHVLVDSAHRRIPAIKKVFRQQGLEYREIRQAPPRMEEAFISLISKMEA